MKTSAWRIALAGFVGVGLVLLVGQTSSSRRNPIAPDSGTATTTTVTGSIARVRAPARSLSSAPIFLFPSPVQPASHEVSACPSRTLTLRAPVGSSFPPRDRSAVVFDACRVITSVRRWTNSVIEIDVPDDLQGSRRVAIYSRLGWPPASPGGTPPSAPPLAGGSPGPALSHLSAVSLEEARFTKLVRRAEMGIPLIPIERDFLEDMMGRYMPVKTLPSRYACSPNVGAAGRLVDLPVAPVIHEFAPTDFVGQLSTDEYEIDDLANDSIRWSVSGTPTSVTLDGVAVPLDGTKPIGGASTARLRVLANGCSAVQERILRFTRVIQVDVTSHVTLNEGVPTLVEFSTHGPAKTPILVSMGLNMGVTKWNSAIGTPAQVSIPVGGSSASGNLAVVDQAAWLAHQYRAFTIPLACAAGATTIPVRCSPSAIEVTVLGEPQPNIPPGHVRLKGVVQHRWGSVPNPVPAIRVDLSHGAVHSVRTNDLGRFDIVVPAAPGVPQAVLIADLPQGKVNSLDDVARTWTSAPLSLSSCGPTTYCLDYVADTVTKRLEEKILGAAAALYQSARTLEAAGVGAQRFGRVTVMPKSAPGTYVTDVVGGHGFLWMELDFMSQHIPHELGHVLAIRAGKYHPWAAYHTGCDEVAWPRREYAFFEGWADYVHFVIGAIQREGCQRGCPHVTDTCLVTATPRACATQNIASDVPCGLPIQPDEVEDYVANVLIEFQQGHDPASTLIMDTYFSTQFNGQPHTLGGFQAAMSQIDPAQGANLRAIMTAHGMP